MDSNTPVSIPEPVSRQELRARLRKKTSRSRKSPSQGASDPQSLLNNVEMSSDPQSILKMMSQVNNVLQQNPQMLDTISKCMSTMFENKDLMNNIKQNIEKELTPEVEPEPIPAPLEIPTEPSESTPPPTPKVKSKKKI
jgi:hypothetical protein